ncbi:alpha/beta fold hydrolase [Yoonia sp.]|uniref:alpha/beta fold hydrolase n=1 Tax=Yoonia sp. TaxID=2212373 RepID=UPI0023B693FD
MVWVIVIGAVVGALLLAAWPIYLERRRRPIGPDARHGADGEFALLSQGVTRFRWAGSARGPVAVLIHGLASPMVTMEAIAKGLGNNGYRVLMYDLYGRGLSDAPQGVQNRAFFLRQLSDLLALHKLKDNITFVGYSMGGAIATAYAAENPGRVKQVLLVAPTGIVTNERGFSRFCRKTSLLGAWVHGMFAERRINKAIPLHGETKAIDMVLRAQRRELKRRGYLPSLLASRRGILREVQEHEHRQLGRQGIRVCAIWAGADKIVPPQAIGKLAEWNRAAQQEVVARADHALPYTHGDQLIAAMRALLHDT